MYMKLTTNQIEKINKRTKFLERNEIVFHLKDQKYKTLLFLQPLIQEELNGWEMVKNQPHPMIFELGHITLFYMHHFLRHFTNYTIHDTLYEMFDSIQNRPNDRNTSQIIAFKDQFITYKSVVNKILNYLETTNEFTIAMSYSLNTCILHNEMHNEVFLFLLDMLGHCNPLYMLSKNIAYSNNTPITNKLIYIEGGTYEQGLNMNERVHVWDNEMPKHKVYVKSFYCNKYPTTNKEYIEFITDGGYTNTELWSFEGKKWLTKNKPIMPYFWKKKNNVFYRKHFDREIPITDNELKKPVVKINVYEAEAYAKYRGCRLPTESEYEYMCTNKGTTVYPWGNETDIEKFSNVDYNNSDVMPVDYYEHNKNIEGIVGLIGDCWYWTSTNFYPYDGYTIEPLYDTFSYPFFYFRRVVKGSSWTCGKQLVYPQYRNAQEPDKSFHYTGIRLVKNI